MSKHAQRCSTHAEIGTVRCTSQSNTMQWYPRVTALRPGEKVHYYDVQLLQERRRRRRRRERPRERERERGKEKGKGGKRKRETGREKEKGNRKGIQEREKGNEKNYLQSMDHTHALQR